MGGGGEGRASASVSDIHAPRLPGAGMSLDEAAIVFSQDEAHQQHLGPARPCKRPSYIKSFNDHTAAIFFTLLNFAPLPHQIILHSMHRYYPRFHITQIDCPSAVSWGPFQTFSFPETTFTAVTAYQNTKVGSCTI